MLVKCKECGSEVSDSAPVCPRCGVPNPAGQGCKIIIHRKRSFTGSVLIVEVLIDGQTVGHIKNGEDRSFNITSPGEHEIIAICVDVFDHVTRRRLIFDINSNQTIEFDCGFSALKGLFLKKMELTQSNEEDIEDDIEEDGGTDTVIYEDGSKYVGEFVDGLRNGRGTLYFDDGSKIEGEWKNDELVE